MEYFEDLKKDYVAEDLTEDEIEEIDSEVADFTESLPDYEVWCFGYDEDDNITDFCILVDSFIGEKEAVNFAKTIETAADLGLTFPKEVKYISLEVETVVQIDQDEFENVDTIYNKFITL